MKKSRQETTLCERDALRDMLGAETLLMGEYAAALSAGSSRPLRRQLFKLYSEHADTQFALFEQLLGRGYCKAEPAPKDAAQTRAEQFAKFKKQLPR